MPEYDRSDLIVVIIVFLFHFRSALIAILALPIAVLMSFIPMYWLGVTSNIMSLGGIALAIWSARRCFDRHGRKRLSSSRPWHVEHSGSLTPFIYA